jgi:hypothetical protein
VLRNAEGRQRVVEQQQSLTMIDTASLRATMRDQLIRRSWPRGAIDLLLQAGIAPRPKANQAWKAWVEARNFDDVTWQEKRLLAAFSERIAVLDPTSPLVSRIEGLTKHMWTAARLTLSQTLGAFDVLAAARIPFIVFKGGALLAEDFASSRRRVLGDVDILVHPENACDVVKALTGDGWCAVNGESPAYLHRLAKVRICCNYRKGQYGEIDVHITPFHYSRSGWTLDDAVWRDAETAKVGSRPILVPDPANAIVISLAHAPHTESAEWAFDIATRVAYQGIDWDKLAFIAKERDLVPSCLAGLRYLRDVLSVSVPDFTIATLTRAPASVPAWMKYWSNVRDRKDRNLAQKAVNRAADRLLRKRDYSVYVKDHVAVTVTRPAVLRRWRLGRAKSIAVPPSDWGYRQQLLVAGGAAGRRLAFTLAVSTPPLSRRIFFDVTADGIAVARLRSRLGPPENHEKKVTFVLPLPEARETDVAISIEARPVAFVPPYAHAELHIANDPLKFRLVSAWTM